ncbi:MAG: DsbA family protein [Actinomycetota bacterium]|nr:DsbA family protein [Actinomycetota bacterium]
MTDADIEIYGDPVCPFTWVTSRWLASAAERGDARVTWRLMSLAVLNEGQDAEGAQAARLHTSRRIGRLVAAATGTDDFGELYTALGRRLHAEGNEMTDELAREALTECGLDPELVSAMDDESWDDAVRAAHQRGQDALGDTGGSPITVVNGRAFFGPVLTEIPAPEEAARIFDGFTALAASPAFAQVERPRSGPPKMHEAEA